MSVLVYGSRPDGHARVLIELFNLDVAGLIDDYPENSSHTINGSFVIGDKTLLELRDEMVVLGFGTARGRGAALEAIVRCAPPLIHPSAHVAASAQIGDASQILVNAYIGPGAQLGAGTLVNTGAIVEHDCVLEEACVVGPGAVLAGRVRLGREVEIGSGAIVIPDVRIGNRVIVGAGAVVIRDVPADVTVVGVPARPS